MTLGENQIIRYSRHILLPDVGGVGQVRLLDAAVEVEVGPGRPAAIAALAYLAAAGVGRLLLGGDPHGAITAEEARTGILFGAADIGRARVDAVRERALAINPDVAVEATGASAPAGRWRLAVREPEAPTATDAVADALVLGGGAAAALLADIVRGRT